VKSYENPLKTERSTQAEKRSKALARQLPLQTEKIARGGGPDALD